MSFAAHIGGMDALALEHLGEDVTYAPSVGGSVTVRGIFDTAYVKVEGGEAGYSSCGPAVFLRLEGLPSDPLEDDFRVTRKGKTYKLREAEPDGQGGVLLLLHWVP